MVVAGSAAWAVPSAARVGDDGQGLDTLLAQGAQAQSTQPLGELLAGGIGDQRQMGEAGRRAAQGRQDGELQGGVGDMVLAADDVADGELGIVDRRGEQVGGAAVLAPHHRIAEVARRRKRRGPRTRSSKASSPSGRSEAPVGPPARRLQRRALGLAQPQRAPVVARGRAAACCAWRRAASSSAVS